MAFGALRALQESGREVPAEVSVVGFDDAPIARQANPPLTTVHQPIEEMGREMARLLVARIRREEIPRPYVAARNVPGRARKRLAPAGQKRRAVARLRMIASSAGLGLSSGGACSVMAAPITLSMLASRAARRSGATPSGSG